MKTFIVSFFLLVGFSAFGHGLCSHEGGSTLSGYDMRQLAELGATVSIRSSSRISTYEVRQIAKAAKSGGAGGEVIVCSDSNDYSGYDLRQLIEAGVKVIILK